MSAPSRSSIGDAPPAVDFVVIGSGAAGAVMAYRLALAGHSVLVLERGRRENTATFSQDEMDMVPRVYKEAGLQTSADHVVTFMQGATVGGSTVINNAIWLRADLERVLPAWAAHGAHIDRARLELAYSRVEAALKVQPIPADMMNEGTGTFIRGCKAMGLKPVRLAHNRVGCVGCGFCNFGCRYDRKTSMLVTFIPWAEARGAVVHDQVVNVSLVQETDAITAVEYWRFGRRHRVQPQAVIVACGGIGSSELLLRNRIRSQFPIGQGFHFLGGSLVAADVPERLDAFDKIGLTSMVDDSDRPDFVIESFFAPPAAFAISLNGFMAHHAERMQRYAYSAEAGAMVGMSPTGRISLDGSKVRIDYTISSEDLARLRRGVKLLTQIFLAGGANAVYPGTYVDLTIARADEVNRIDELVTRPSDLLVGSAHPQGGNAMSSDPKRGVVGCDFRVHGYRNLFVSDTSVWPENIWRNCQATAMAMAYVAADFVLAGSSARVRS